MLHPWNTFKLQISFCRVGYYTRHSLYASVRSTNTTYIEWLECTTWRRR
jgi:hypothetical protein